MQPKVETAKNQLFQDHHTNQKSVKNQLFQDHQCTQIRNC